MKNRLFDSHTSNEDGIRRQKPKVTVEQILHFGQHLSFSDRALLRAVYERGVTAAAIAQAVGESPKIVQNRLRRLCQRMASPAFRYVVRHRADWPDDRRAIADAVILRGNTQRAAAATLQTSLHRVRQELDRIRALSEATPRDLPTGISSNSHALSSLQAIHA